MIDKLISFTPREFDEASPEERLRMYKEFITTVVRIVSPAPFSWEREVQAFRKDPMALLETCSHKIQVYALVLEFENKIDTLHKSMEDLVNECRDRVGTD